MDGPGSTYTTFKTSDINIDLCPLLRKFFEFLPQEVKKGIEEGSGKDTIQIIGKIERETDKAILITDAKLWCEHSKKWCSTLGEKKIWLPKSQIEIER